MSSRTLKYVLHPKEFGFICTYKKTFITHGILKINDAYKVQKEYFKGGKNVGEYTVSISAKIRSKKELLARQEEIADLIILLDKAFLCTYGFLLTTKYLNISALSLICKTGKVDGWEDNNVEIEDWLDRNKKIKISLSAEMVHWGIFEELPLLKAYDAILAIPAAPEPVSMLINMYYAAHKTQERSSRLFLFAKCMEIVESVLPGKSRKEKSKHLSDLVKDNLKGSLEQLYNISNNRKEIRHIIKNKETITPHPTLTTDEWRLFIHDSDLIIRSIICNSIGLDLSISRELM